MSNEQTIKVSVIIPIYNAAEYLASALDTVLAQSLREIEVICINDASTDASRDIVLAKQKTDSRICLLEIESNAGPCVARNMGLAKASGKYVSFLDADDFFEPNMLEVLYDLAERDSLEMAVGGYDLYRNRSGSYSPAVPGDEEKQFVPGEVTSKSKKPHVIFQLTDGYVWNKLFLRSFLSEKGITFDENTRLFEDVVFTFSVMSLAERIERTDKVLMHHRVYSEQSRDRMFKKYYEQIPDVYLTMKRFLTHKGLYLPLANSFSRLSATRCYHVYNLLWIDAKIAFWNRLHNLAEALGWDDSTPTAIDDEKVKNFVVQVETYTYGQHVRRDSLGLKLRFKEFVRKQRTEKKRKDVAASIKDFFRHLFKKDDEEDPKF